MALASWHAIFWINVPLAILAGILFAIYSPTPPPRSRRGWQQLNSLVDWPGLGLFAGTISFALIWAVGLENRSNGMAIIYAAVLFAGLLVVEAKRSQPIIPIKWFVHPKFLVSSVLTTLSNIVMYSILYGVPVSEQNMRHVSPKISGILLLAFAGVMTLASPWGGRLAQTKARRKPLIIAGVFLSGGMALLLNIRTLPWPLIVGGLMLTGLSFALSNVLLQQSLLESVPPPKRGELQDFSC